MKSDEHHALSFTLGQIAAFQGLFQSDQDDNALGQAILAMRLLSRLWLQFCEDRPNLNLTSSLLSVESERNRPAFIACLRRAAIEAKHPRWQPLEEAIRLTSRAVAPPPPAFTEEIENLVKADLQSFDEFNRPLGDDQISPVKMRANDQIFPVTSFFWLAQDFAEIAVGSHQVEDQCWLLNLILGANPRSVGLTQSDIPFPAPLRRRCLRIDLDPEERKAAVLSSLCSSSHRHLSDLHSARLLAVTFAKHFASRRTTSRLDQAWVLLAGLGTLSARQLARALDVSENGARQMLRRLENGGFAGRSGAYWSASLSFRLHASPPGWAQIPD